LGKAITVRSTDTNDAGVVIKTIINAGGSGRVVLCNSGEGSDTVLSGFVITGGSVNVGGGMRNINGSSPTVTNCTFDGNTANNHGGGMSNEGGFSPTVTNTGFCNNTPSAITGPYTNGGGNSLVYCAPSIPIPDTCPADVNNDGIVGINDFLDLLSAWGPCP